MQGLESLARRFLFLPASRESAAMSRHFGPAIQTCYLADDLEPALDYWTRQLGVGPFFILPVRQFMRLTRHGVETDRRDIISAVALGQSGDMQIEIIVPGPDPSTYRDFLDAGHRGVHHLGVAAHDYDAQLATARAVGMTVAMEGHSQLTRFAYLEGDTARPGTVIELIEMTPAISGLFKQVRDASIGWDGRDPIRRL